MLLDMGKSIDIEKALETLGELLESRGIEYEVVIAGRGDVPPIRLARSIPGQS